MESCVESSQNNIVIDEILDFTKKKLEIYLSANHRYKENYDNLKNEIFQSLQGLREPQEDGFSLGDPPPITDDFR